MEALSLSSNQGTTHDAEKRSTVAYLARALAEQKQETIKKEAEVEEEEETKPHKSRNATQ